MTQYNPAIQFSPIAPPIPTYNEIQQQTAVNNAFASHVKSWERRGDAECKLFDMQNVNRLRDELSHCTLLPLQERLDVSAHFPLWTLPAHVRTLVSAVSGSLGVSPEMVLPCILGAALVAARGRFSVNVGEHHSEVLTSYFLVAAPSGERKSAVVDIFRRVFQQEEDAMRARHSTESTASLRRAKKVVLARLEADLANDFQQLLLEHGEIELVQTLLTEKACSVERVRMAMDTDAAPPRLLASIATPEALAAEMAKQGEALGIFEAEGGLLKRLRASADDIFLKGYTGEAFNSDTRTMGATRLLAPVLTICVLAQPNVLEDLYSDESLAGHGLLARFLPVFPPAKSASLGQYPCDIPPESIDWYETQMQNLLRLPGCDRSSRTNYRLNLSRGGKAELDRFSRQVEAQVRAGDFEWSAAFGSKLVGHATRLAGAVHLLSHPDPQSQDIGRDTIKCGIDLAEYFRCHAAVAFSSSARDGVTYAPKILQWMRRHRVPHFTERDAARGIGSSRHTMVQIRAGIDELERHNVLRRYVNPGRSSICVVHPSLYWGI